MQADQDSDGSAQSTADMTAFVSIKILFWVHIFFELYKLSCLLLLLLYLLVHFLATYLFLFCPLFILQVQNLLMQMVSNFVHGAMQISCDHFTFTEL